MYHHANTNINSQSPDHASISTKSSEARQRQIPLAFTNTEWGREYIANPNWEQDNLGKSNAPLRQKSRVQPDQNGKSIPASIPFHDTPTIKSADTSIAHSSSSASALAPSTVSPKPSRPSQQYSVMVAWNLFRRTFPPSSPAFSESPECENRYSVRPQQEEVVELGPWLEMLMRWDDFEQWQLKMLQRSWWLSGTP
jgi:hypothetical protein